MSSFDVRKLKVNEYINNALPQIIEAFVEYYGEENREYITNRFNSMIMIGYGNPTNANGIISKIQSSISDRLLEDILNKMSIPEESKSEMKNILFGNYGIKTYSIMPIKKYEDFKRCSKNDTRYQSYLTNAVTFLKNLYPTVTNDNIVEMMESGAFSNIDAILEELISAQIKYEKELEEIQEYIVDAEKNKKTEQELLKLNSQEYIKGFYDIIPEDEKIKIEEGIQKGYLNMYSMKVTQAYLGSSLYDQILAEAFSKENEEILLTGTGWRIENIKKDRIKFFKAFGIDLGDNYEDYINNEECKKIIPTEELIQKIVESKRSYKEKALNDFYNSTSEYLYNLERLKARNLYLSQDSYNAKAYHNKNTFITANLTAVEDGFELVPILCFNNATIEEIMDKNLIHELNHVYELYYLGCEDKEHDFICGWDIISQREDEEISETPSLKDRQNKREYELFNEIINEILAQQISELMHKKGMYILNDETNVKDFGGTGYQSSLFLVVEFFNNFRNEIIQSRRNGNIQIIFDKVGKENFDELNGLFHEFNEYFGGMKVYNLYDDINNGLETERVIKYNELKARRDKIVSLMIEYSNQMTL